MKSLTVITAELGAMAFKDKDDIAYSLCLSDNEKTALIDAIEKCEEYGLFCPIHFSDSGMILQFVGDHPKAVKFNGTAVYTS